MRRTWIFACLLLMIVAPINVAATSRVAENLDADYLVREHVVLNGRKKSVQDFVLIVDLRDIDDLNFFSQLESLEQTTESRFAVILTGNISYLLKDFDETMAMAQDRRVIIESAMVLVEDAKAGTYSAEHLDTALQYMIEKDRANLKTNVAKYVAKKKVDLVEINMYSSCMTEYREECELGYFSDHVNLESGFLKANELLGERALPIFYYGDVETAWYMSEALLASGVNSGQRGITVKTKCRPGLYDDADFILNNGGKIAFDEFLSSYNGDDALADYFNLYGVEIEESAADSARLIDLWASWTAMTDKFVSAKDVLSGAYRYTNMERALYFAQKEIAKTKGDIYYLKREREFAAPVMQNLYNSFDAWLQAKTKTFNFSDDEILNVIVGEVASKYEYGK